ncbi:uncharacterized protein G2W53_036960 [Senna tora]|uniref:Uncharacterized protein n=1 Tax=Senna tora TaxID=362788 RepID=A0A834W5M1_9FABA|nr:uncharacterized protein G2W53_036960 [Senna tora]
MANVSWESHSRKDSFNEVPYHMVSPINYPLFVMG